MDVPISMWLESVSTHLVQYVHVFEEAGYESTEFLTDLESDGACWVRTIYLRQRLFVLLLF